MPGLAQFSFLPDTKYALRLLAMSSSPFPLWSADMLRCGSLSLPFVYLFCLLECHDLRMVGDCDCLPTFLVLCSTI